MRHTVTAFGDAVADAFVRTAAAPLAGGQHAFAGREPVDVHGADEWLTSVAAGTQEPASTALRLVPPDDPTNSDEPFTVVVLPPATTATIDGFGNYVIELD